MRYPNEILVVEAKALIAPDEINEVHTAGKELSHAQRQVNTAIRILRAMSSAEKKQKFKFVNWDDATAVFGAVITTDAEPHVSVSRAPIPVLTYNSLRWRFAPKHFRSPGRFWRACVERPWQESEIVVGESGYKDVRVGDLTYRLPVSAVDLGSR